MQISKVEVVPVELRLRVPYRTAYNADHPVEQVEAIFVRIETRRGLTAWGCAAPDPVLTGESLEGALQACRACADVARDLNPLNIEYALAQLSDLTTASPVALGAFDMAFHDLVGLAAGLPLYRLLGGYRNRIATSVTIGLTSVRESVEQARIRARQGFRILKIKGGPDPEVDVERVKAIHQAMPNIVLRLDADQGYTVRQALDVARALGFRLEMLEQPVPAADLEGLRQVKKHSPVPVLADESVRGPESALEIATRRAADGLSVKLATCGGFRQARQMDAIARAARMTTMVGCVNEPALLTAAGLMFALSSPNVRYGDLDGHFDLLDDPTVPGFRLEEGVLVAGDVPGLGCVVEL